jgi:hypothetical protein
MQLAPPYVKIPDTDTYYGVALRRTQGSEKSDVYGTKVLWVDVDKKELPRATIPPSIIVHSGGGWHLYWILNKWHTDIPTIEEANRILAEDVEGDKCYNANRLLRVPGTTNTKYGVKCEFRQSRNILIGIEDIATLSRLDSKVRHKIRTGDRRGYTSRSERDWSIVSALVDSGANDSFIGFIFENCACGDKYRDPEVKGDAYLTQTIERARENKQEVSVADKRKRGPIIEREDGYYADTSKGVKRLSTFVLEPTLLLQGDAEDTIVCNVRAEEFTWKDVRFPRAAFNDRRSLDKILTVTAWSWLGRDDDVRQLLPFLLHKLTSIGLPKTKATSVLGRHGDYFVTNTQCVSKDGLWNGVNAPIVFMAPQRERPTIEYTFGDMPNLSLITRINRPSVIWPILGWYMATPYKPVIEGYDVRFPILNLFGTKGSGKTSLLRVFQELLGSKETRSYDCDTTRFIKLTLLGSSNAVPISFSEHRAAVTASILRYVLLAYDTGHDPRGRADQTTQDYSLSAPFTIDGEDQVGDPAAMERIIAVRLSPSDIEEGTPYWEEFKKVLDTPLQGFAGPYVQYTLAQDVKSLLDRSRKIVLDTFPQRLPDRVRNNLSVIALGIESFCDFTHVSRPDYKEALLGTLATVWNESLGRGRVLADQFCEDVVNAVMRPRVEFYYKILDGIIWIQLATAYTWWLKQQMHVHGATLNREAIRDQMMERSITRGGKGQYVVSPQMVGDVWCYGISLQHAFESGLDIPKSLVKSQMIIDLK